MARNRDNTQTDSPRRREALRDMATRTRRFCGHPGCTELVVSGYCEAHSAQHEQSRIDSRESASRRGYDSRWRAFSKRYLARPENQFCALRISPRCNHLAECVDHIHPLQGPRDPRKYDKSNLQPACNACNTLKRQRVIVGRHRD